jgi:hypothetical protein
LPLLLPPLLPDSPLPKPPVLLLSLLLMLPLLLLPLLLLPLLLLRMWEGLPPPLFLRADDVRGGARLGLLLGEVAVPRGERGVGLGLRR